MRYLFLVLLLPYLANAQAQPRTVRTFAGAVHTKYPVSLTLTTDDNLAYGTLMYKRTGIPIRVVGTIEGVNLLLHEFDKQATITGIFNGKASAKGYLGSWISPSRNGRELTFSLTETSRKQAPARAPLTLTGTYTFTFGKDFGFGQLYVQQLPNKRIAVAMEGNRGAPSYNMANVSKTTLKLRGNQAIYSNTEYGKCTIKLTFFEGGASVVYVGDDYDCGFGNGATVTGNYIKSSSKAPTFPEQK